MSHFAHMSLHKACIEYKRKFRPNNMLEVKLKQTFDDGMTKTRVCCIFSGVEGVEGLFHTKDRFNLVVKALQFTQGDELFDNFEQVLLDTVLDRWLNRVSQLTAAQRTVNWFNAEYANFL